MDAIEVLISDDEFSRLEASLPFFDSIAQIHRAVTLGWHLRQRDSRRAIRQVEYAEVLLGCINVPSTDAVRYKARLQLIRSETEWLFARLDSARQYAESALSLARDIGDLPGCADAHYLLSQIAANRGDSALHSTELQNSRTCALEAGDQLRVDFADVTLAIAAVYQDARRAEFEWGPRFPVADSAGNLCLSPWISEFWGAVAYQTSDFGTSIKHRLPSLDTALRTGQLQRAIRAATNTGATFNSLNDPHAALEWMQRGLDLAKPTEWPSSIGNCLMQTGETLRLLGRHGAAQELLSEALSTLGPLSATRTYAIALLYLGDLALDRSDFVVALDHFKRLQERAEALCQPDLQAVALRGQAHAFLHLGRLQEAQGAAVSALTLARAQGDASREIAALHVLSDVLKADPTLEEHGATAGSESLRCLLEALDIGSTISGYTIPDDLLDSISGEYARIGNFAEAYQFLKRANGAREKIRGQEAINRSIAAQVRHQTERERAESAHLRQVAISEANRAAALQKVNQTLEKLGTVGQEITAHLQTDAVFEVLDRQVHGLLDAACFAIYMMDPGGTTLTSVYDVENGQRLPVSKIDLTNPKSFSAKCIRERREILVDLEPDSMYTTLVPGTLPTQSLLFAPLIIGDRVLGLMTIQSVEANAYGERERLIFRTLCAYGAIALDNATAYRQIESTLKTLRDTQAELIEKNNLLAKAYQSLEDVSLTDPLTGLRNRRFLLQHLEADVAMTLRRYDERYLTANSNLVKDADLLFFLVDIDHFKSVNDQFGHAAGDAVLMEVGRRLRQVVRESDYLIRWGGEEFLLVARATNRREAELVAERIRTIIAETAFDLPDGQKLMKTCSVGYACFPFLPSKPGLLTWFQVVELADQGLYMAKNRGRDAWVGVSCTDLTQADDIYQRLLQKTSEAAKRGEIRLVSSRPLQMEVARTQSPA